MRKTLVKILISQLGLTASMFTGFTLFYLLDDIHLMPYIRQVTFLAYMEKREI